MQVRGHVTHGGREEAEDWLQAILMPQTNTPVGAAAQKHVGVERRPLQSVDGTLHHAPPSQPQAHCVQGGPAKKPQPNSWP